MGFRFGDFLTRLIFLLICGVLAGCASSGASKIKEGALELVGLGKSGEASGIGTTRPLRVQLYAGSNLNADSRGRPMAVVLKFYRLRDPGSFMHSSYDVLSDPEKEKAALASDLIDVKELVVTPGQDLQRLEVLNGEASYLGVVALFRKPHPDRWRLVFAGNQATNLAGIVMGAHACALTVSQGTPFNAQLVNAGSLGGVLCR